MDPTEDHRDSLKYKHTNIIKKKAPSECLPSSIRFLYESNIFSTRCRSSGVSNIFFGCGDKKSVKSVRRRISVSIGRSN
jgi:hypothetical protein